jgi:two-component system response regulator NreC
MPDLRILLADDHAVLREGLAMLIDAQPDMDVVAQARSGREATHLCCSLMPDVVVLDISMPDMDGAETAEYICEHCPGARILALTRHGDNGYLRRMLAAGAAGYVLKRTAADALIHAIRTVAAGGVYVDPSLMGTLVPQVLGRPNDLPEAARKQHVSLSDREDQVLRAIAWGLSNKEVATKLGLSVKTVESYKASALQKLGLRTRADILRYAVAERWLAEDAAPE